MSTRMHLKNLIEQLPSKEEFYSRLSEEDITNDDCNKARQIRKHFDIENMGVYPDLHLQTDVLPVVPHKAVAEVSRRGKL